MELNNTEMLTVGQVAALLGVAQSCISSRLRAGTLKGTRLGLGKGVWVIARSDALACRVTRGRPRKPRVDPLLGDSTC